MDTPRFYLVIDVEATCDEDHRIPREQTEIIEVGAVLCAGATLAPVAQFQTFVKPFRHPRLTPFCTRLTSIKQADVDAAPGFAQAMQKLAAFLSEQEALGQFTFCSWGDYDRQQFARDERRVGTRAPLGPQHINLKEAFCRRSGENAKLGCGQALRRVGLRFVGTAHRGIDDARNIARLLPYCLGRSPIPAARQAH
jgi:inhibitor of KinA sporulation pathway (predicted exonuclease)